MDIGVSSHLVDLSLDRCVDESLKLTIEGINNVELYQLRLHSRPRRGSLGLGLGLPWIASCYSIRSAIAKIGARDF